MTAIRITPAYAGKSFAFAMIILYSRDHPRLCGEKFEKLSKKQKVVGSPPPMRGKVASCPLVEENARITPAYAGKRNSFSLGRRKRWDHPRLCGEKRKIFRKINSQTGSPPPMRGKGACIGVHRHGDRITPAYAGKS